MNEMKFRLLLSVVISFAVVVVGHLFYHQSLSASAQEPRRWLSGDTLWLEIDSLPIMPSGGRLYDDSLFMLLLPLHSRSELQVDFTPRRESMPHIEFDYTIPYWSVYRRSVTVWGITFSAGQISPYVIYPAGAHQDATVLSFPLQPPR